MGRYFEQTESRSELQQRIAADLREKASLGVYCTDGSWRICVIRISGE